MSPDVQVRLLRVLQEKRIARVGDTREFSVDVRIVAATNRDLRREVEERRFREDLFYRLAVVTITLPPLRARVPDIAPLALHLIEKNRQELNKNIHGIDPDGISKLERYHWPGNIRELDNVIQRAIIVARTENIEPDDLLLETQGKGNNLADLAKLPFSEAQIVFERQYFTELLQQGGDNVTKAAARARIDRTVLHAHLKKIGWTREREQAAG
jgi:transcriptional regulator with PAS, ATPase and Fis domain